MSQRRQRAPVGHPHAFPANSSITDMSYYGFLIKMTKLDSDQYPRAEKTRMLILPDTVFIRAANRSFKQFTKLAPGRISVRLLQVRLPPACVCSCPLTSPLLSPQHFLALGKNLLPAVLSPGRAGNALLAICSNTAQGEKKNRIPSVVQANRDCSPLRHAQFRGQQWLQTPV